MPRRANPSAGRQAQRHVGAPAHDLMFETYFFERGEPANGDITGLHKQSRSHSAQKDCGKIGSADLLYGTPATPDAISSFATSFK